LSANGWVLGPVSDTGAMSRAEDQGPAVALDTRGGVHIVTPNGVYGFSGDGGRSWKIESIPLPPAMRVKTASLAVDPLGIVHVAFTAPVTRVIRPAAGKLGQYWQLRTISRAADGKWFGTANVLEGAPGWGEPSGPDDVLADWARIAADPKGGMHLTWHGTAYSRQYAHDAAFYAWQKPGAAWRTPIALLPRNSAREGSSAPFSYAPSLALDGERALALTFYDVFDGPKVQYFDTALSAFAQGRVEKLAMPVTQFVQAAVAAKRPELAMSLRFPAAAPEVWHGPGGQTMLDVLELLQSPFEPAGANIVVYQQLNLTAMLSGKR